MTFSRRPGARFNRGRIATRAGVGGGGGGDVTEPGTTSRIISADGTYMDWTFDEAMDQTSTPLAAAITFAGTSVTVASNTWQSATVLRTTVVGRFLGSETVTITYTVGAAPIQDLAGNDHDDVVAGAVTNNSGIALETVLDTYYADGSLADTEYVPYRPGAFLAWGAGGGGDGTGGIATQNGTGQSGYFAEVDIASMDPGDYSWTLGVGGTAGANGGSTNGTSTEVLDPASAVIARAIGGARGVSGAVGVGGTGGNGDTPVGDVLRDGGVGSGGTTSRGGGGTPGSATDASGTTPGEPEGQYGVDVATNLPGWGVGGSCRTSAVGHTGGSGFLIVSYQRAVVAASRPYVTAIAYGRDEVAQTTRSLTVPGSFTAGDKMLALATYNGSAGSSMSGYTEKADLGTTGIGLCYARDCTGSDAATLVTPSASTKWKMLRIANAITEASWSITSGAITAAALDPPSNNHGSSVDALWFACGSTATGGTTYSQVTAFPTSYESRQMLPGRVNSNELLVCSRPLLATQTADPGVFTRAISSSGAVLTLCIPKA